ncbi:hypothetical protein AB1283_01040 [Bacillus sp. S13(2024)]|uniref:hypothetical protein n=1 Tax=Bacillus sp. S13(2024) TaxID=3162885 RepID=UPI003D1C484C
MARKCSCAICKNKGNTDVFYKVTDEKGKSKYYCNKEEYDNFINEKNKRENLINYILFDVFNYEEGQLINSILFKKIKELNSFYDYEVVLECFGEQKENIQYWIKTKEFTSEYNMICYVMKIIEGNINDTHKKWKFKKKQELKRENNLVDFEILNQLDNEKITNTNNSGILAFLDKEDI